MSLSTFLLTLKGGSGSGNFNHVGILGHRGGSAPNKINVVITQIEEEIRNQDFESVVVIDQDGNIVARKDGSKQDVIMNNDLKEAFKGNIIIHNHPDDHTFSSNDLVSFIRNKGSEMRLVTPNWNASLVRTGPINLENLAEDLMNISSSVRREFILKIHNGEISRETAEIVHHHEVLKKLSKDYNFEYKRERVY